MNFRTSILSLPNLYLIKIRRDSALKLNKNKRLADWFGGRILARQFQMPENLDIGYKFLNGKFTMKEMLFRAIGVPPAIVVGALLYGITESKAFVAFSVILLLAFGYWFGAKKVFNKTIPLIIALQYSSELNRKTTELYNYRDYENTTPHNKLSKENERGK